MSTQSRILTVRELADYLRVHTSTIYRLLKFGQLPGFKVGSDWRFNIETIDEWRLSKSSVEPNPAQQVNTVESERPRRVMIGRARRKVTNARGAQR